MKIENRFLKYVSFDTQSSETSETAPTTSKQIEFADFLAEEMRILGMKDVERNEYGIVYGTIPANVEEEGETIGFISHMDTSPDASGKDVKPQIIRDYDGGIIKLNNTMNLDPEENPELKTLIHHDLITTDGTTLLGADDKAGIAIIMTMAEYLFRHPTFLHHDISIAFTPDEEVGRGVINFDIDRFGADYAYTVDGGPIEEYSFENFNAYKATVSIKGKSYHPGDAKNKMINALTLGRDFDILLGDVNRPEHTEEHDGFYHLHNMEGDVSNATLSYIIREHSKEKMEELLAHMNDAAAYINNKYGDEYIKIETVKQYENMKDIIAKRPEIVTQVSDAMIDIGLSPVIAPIRGGTDGAMLSAKGLPTPNLGTGGYNYHGPYEYASLTSMKKGVELLLAIIRNSRK